MIVAVIAAAELIIIYVCVVWLVATTV